MNEQEIGRIDVHSSSFSAIDVLRIVVFWMFVCFAIGASITGRENATAIAIIAFAIANYKA